MQKANFFYPLFRPGLIFTEIAKGNAFSSPALAFMLPVLLILPPLFLWLGTGMFGWRLGSASPLYMENTVRLIISLSYFGALCIGFFGTVYIAQWMGSTYGVKKSSRAYFSLLTVVFFPITVASIAHIYPNGFFNVLILLPTLIWCMSLLYRGLPVALEIPPERGMLMSTSLVGWLLVGAVSILGISVGLWTVGIGPSIAV
ncbi:MAG: hypothetical protein CMP91_10015 [Gammaproteobacteria bacterium]|nr:hypothetical protein [Gammaproteobacteria bacterium]MAY03765.1 hypothetical protein [Gammaproteobacteria bacterium]|tara:strand:- start:2235 stop:2837 length:603 start_codon:yes stop_codon:yes gene_type:complete